MGEDEAFGRVVVWQGIDERDEPGLFDQCFGLGLFEVDEAGNLNGLRGDGHGRACVGVGGIAAENCEEAVGEEAEQYQ